MRTPPAETRPTPPLNGVSLIAGEPVAASASGVLRSVRPQSGEAFGPPFTPATPADVERACTAAWTAFHELDTRSGADRADFLEALAKRVTDLGPPLIDAAEAETAFTPVRLTAERERVVANLRLFAAAIRSGDSAQAIIDPAEPARRPVPRPDVRRINRPLGPVALFGPASSPLACGVVGGDTASALAAGCPVVFKGHPGLPATGEMLARAVVEAAAEARLPAGVFSYLVGDWAGEARLGAALASNLCIRAVGFTGSPAAGQQVEAAMGGRGDRAPLLAITGGPSPVFVLPGAGEEQTTEICSRLATAALAGAGQTCLNPGVVFLVRSGETELGLRAMADVVSTAPAQHLVHARAAARFAAGVRGLVSARGAEVRAGDCPLEVRARRDGSAEAPLRFAPVLLRASFEAFRAEPRMRGELFGPVLLAVVCDHEGQLMEAASLIQGALTACLWSGLEGATSARRLQTVLEQRVGRLLFNSLPGWLEPCAAMMHGGPHPVSTRPDLTAAGPLAAARWTRPITYQNAPEAFLPAELRTPNPRRIRRLVEGVWTHEPGRPAAGEREQAA